MLACKQMALSGKMKLRIALVALGLVFAFVAYEGIAVPLEDQHIRWQQ